MNEKIVFEGVSERSFTDDYGYERYNLVSRGEKQGNIHFYNALDFESDIEDFGGKKVRVTIEVVE